MTTTDIIDDQLKELRRELYDPINRRSNGQPTAYGRTIMDKIGKLKRKKRLRDEAVRSIESMKGGESKC